MAPPVHVGIFVVLKIAALKFAGMVPIHSAKMRLDPSVAGIHLAMYYISFVLVTLLLSRSVHVHYAQYWFTFPPSYSLFL